MLRWRLAKHNVGEPRLGCLSERMQSGAWCAVRVHNDNWMSTAELHSKVLFDCPDCAENLGSKAGACYLSTLLAATPLLLRLLPLQADDAACS